MGELESVFVAEDSAVDVAIGREVYFGEALGKHSEIYCNLEREHFEKLSDDQSVCGVIERYIGSTGHNPLDYLEDEYDEKGRGPL